jgi:transcriptional regulator with XRE-family HTH domain
MGTKSRPKPEKLAAKLLKIRTDVGLSQDDFIERLGLRGVLVSASVSQYERGVREPSYVVLLKYAKFAGISTDYLIDDELELPNQFLGKQKQK